MDKEKETDLVRLNNIKDKMLASDLHYALFIDMSDDEVFLCDYLVRSGYMVYDDRAGVYLSKEEIAHQN